MNDIMKWKPTNTDRIETKKWTPLYSIVSGILIQFDVKSKPVITTNSSITIQVVISPLSGNPGQFADKLKIKTPDHVETFSWPREGNKQIKTSCFCTDHIASAVNGGLSVMERDPSLMTIH